MDATVVSQFIGKGPPREGAYRKIPGGPLYEVGDVLKLLSSHTVKIWTQSCQRDVLNWKLEEEDVCELVKIAVKSLDQFHDSEWCLQEADGSWAACDAYTVKCRKWRPHARIKPGMKFYVKFAIHHTGKKLLLISCHPSKTGGERDD